MTLQQDPQGRAQPMHLVDQVQDDPDTLVVDADALPQVADQPGAGGIPSDRAKPASSRTGAIQPSSIQTRNVLLFDADL